MSHFIILTKRLLALLLFILLCKPICIQGQSPTGDVNSDGYVTIADVTTLIDILLGNYHPSTNPLENDTISLDGVDFVMIAVEGGTYKMGNAFTTPATQPVHRVTLSSFKICETEITQAQWAEVLGYNNSYHKNAQGPVTNVTWYEIQTFIRELNSLTGHNFRLPTEAEWEFAARGGNKSEDYTYSGSNTLSEVSWYNTTDYNAQMDPQTVKKKKPNELGIYDMSGNADEWCSDWYGSYESGQQTNPVGPESGTNKVVRGGNRNNWAASHTVFARSSRDPSTTTNYAGFRLVLDE